MNPDSVNAFAHPLFFVAQALAESGLICDHCKWDVLSDFAASQYGQPLEGFLRAYPSLCSGQHLGFSRQRARDYFHQHADAAIRAVRLESSRAQLWFVLKGRFDFSEMFTRNVSEFLDLHVQRLMKVSFGDACSCPDKAVKQQAEAGQPAALFDRIFWCYLDSGVRTMVVSRLIRDFPAEAQAQLSLMNPYRALLAIIEQVQRVA